MSPRLVPGKAAPETYKAVLALENHLKTVVELRLLHLLKLRASQINGCAFCIDMHVKEALDDGEDPQRLHLLSAWRESPLYNERERALLGWTEALTLLPQPARRTRTSIACASTSRKPRSCSSPPPSA